MIRPKAAMSPATRRLSLLAELTPVDLAALRSAQAQCKLIPPRREIVSEGQRIVDTKLLVKGWAARVRLLPDGRRQLLSFILPGDLIGCCDHPKPLAISSVITLTEVAVAIVPAGESSPGLRQAYAVSRALEEAHLLAHITRLGRLNAQERITDLFLELHERLGLCGLAYDDCFDLPLTQEVLADALGLTSVHINRMLQLSRREGDFVVKGRSIELNDPVALASKLGRVSPKISF